MDDVKDARGAGYEILLPFCAKEEFRYAIDRVFFRGGLAFATDGRVLACLPCNEPDSERPATGGLYPDFIPMLAPHRDVTPTNTFEGIEIRSLKKDCDVCDGTGKECFTCQACDGSGECPYCESGDCHECDGEGTIDNRSPIDCGICGGVGLTDDYRAVVLDRGEDKFYFNGRYVEMLMRLPGVRWVISTDNTVGILDAYKRSERMLFSFDGGGRGLLMPMDMSAAYEDNSDFDKRWNAQKAVAQ